MAKAKRRWHISSLLTAGLLILALLLHHPAWSKDPSTTKTTRLVETGNITNVTVPADARHIKFGIQILDVDNLNVSEMTFLATGWYWLKWDQGIQDMLERDNLKIEDVVKPVNLIEPWYSKFEPAGEGVIQLESGDYYQLFSFSGTFFFNDLDQHKAPFITLWTPINFEIDPSRYALGNPDEIYLIPDSGLDGSILGSFGDLNAFETKSVFLGSYAQKYPGSFGLRQGTQSYSGVQLDIIYTASFWNAFVEYMLPIILVFLLLIISPFSSPNETEFRLSAPATAILTFIFLQSFSINRFPPTPIVSYMDEIYVYCYLASIAIFILFLWSSNKLNESEPNENPACIAQIRKVERIVQTSCVTGMVLIGVGGLVA